MKKKLILGSSIAAMTLAVVSLTSCGGNGKIVTPEVLDTTLVENSSTNSKYYSSLMVSNNYPEGSFLIDTANNKITNIVTGKSIIIDDLASYTPSTQYIDYNYGSTGLLKLGKDNSGIFHLIFLDNSLDKIVEIDSVNYSVPFYLTSSDSKYENGVTYYTANYVYSYRDSNNENQEKSFGIEINDETKAEKVINESATKDFNKRNYWDFINGYYLTIDKVEENHLIKVYDSSYNEIGELETNAYFEFDFSEQFGDKIYMQGTRDVPETYKNLITRYDSNNDTYDYLEVKTYCVDLTKKKIKEIDTEAIFIRTCNGNKDSEYLVANYYELNNNTFTTDTYYTGFFKDGELEYKLPVSIDSMETDVKKVDDNYLITNGATAYLFDKDMKLVNTTNLNAYGVYSDNVGFKKNYYDATGKCIYSTENNVSESYLNSYGYATEMNSDNEVVKYLVFKDGKVEVINKTDDIRISYGFIITKDTTNTDKYTIKQVGGTASVTVYSSSTVSLTNYGSNYYRFTGGTVYSDAEKTKIVQYMYCLK